MTMTTMMMINGSIQPNMNSTIKVAARFAEELNKLNENSDTKKEGIQHIKTKLGESLKKKMGKQSNSWPLF
jgi:hypothetical protein